jgi:imidazoleglycerol-phosphate dehydratase/histidinol-phosphatase
MKVLFVDRDGTLVEEPHDEQVDALDKVRFLPDVFAGLTRLREAGFTIAMVTNQDGLGTSSFPQERFDAPHRFIMDTFRSQGIEFVEVFVCPHTRHDGCDCRKPKTALVDDWIRAQGVDLASSAMVGDRDTDLGFATNLGIRGLRVRVDGAPEETWSAIARELTARRAAVTRETRETRIRVRVDLDSEATPRARTGIGDKRGIARYGFLLPMDEARAQTAIDLSGRPYAVFEGRFGRESVGGLPTELVPHFFRSLAESLGAALHVSVTGDNAHHMIEACFKATGRALRQAIRREGATLPSTKGVL